MPGGHIQEREVVMASPDSIERRPVWEGRGIGEPQHGHATARTPLTKARLIVLGLGELSDLSRTIRMAANVRALPLT